MSFLPAGAEDSEDDDMFFDDYEPQKGGSDLNSEPITSTPITKPKRIALLKSTNSSSAPLCLNDIRMAVMNGNLELLQSLTEPEDKFFADTVLMAGWTALMYASNNGHKHIVHYLLERGADPNYHLDNFTPLMAVCTGTTASEEDQIGSAQYLIRFGANVNTSDKYGNSALIFAAKSGKAGLTQVLIDSKAEINRPNNDGWNALHWAVSQGHGRVVEKLLSNNIDITVKTNSSQSAADIALSKGHPKINEILENIRQRISDCSNGVENNDNQSRRLSDEEMKTLENYVKPVVPIECREKSKTRVKRSGEELENFLMQTNYSYLLSEFEKKGFCYQDLVTNTEETLRKIGVNDLSIIRKISSHIILIHRQDWKKESLKELSLETNISCPEILCILSNIANHLSRMDETIVFLKNRIRQMPEILSHSTEVTPKDQVLRETLQSLINTRSLYNEIQSLRHIITSFEDISEPQTPDVLAIPFTLEDELNNNVHKKSSKFSRSLLISLISVGVLGICAVKYGNVNKHNLFIIMQSIPRPKFSKFTTILLTL